MTSALFPFLSEDAGNEEAEQQGLSMFREYDADEKGVRLVDGKTVIVEGLSALIIWIRKALITQRYRYAAYSWDFGSELDTLIGQEYTPAFIRTEAERLVQEALMISPYIMAVEVVLAEMQDGILHIGCQVDTVYGEVEVNV